MSKKFKSQKGFTLTELLVVISITAILSTVAIIGFTHYFKRSAISHDNILVNKVNLLLNDYYNNHGVPDDNTIAILVQENVGIEADIETKNHGMNIYYNKEKCGFEVMSNEYDSRYKTLDYYLNAVTFHINKIYLYESKWDKIETFESTNDYINISITNDDLVISVVADNYSTPKVPNVDLSKIIYAKNPQGYQNNIKYELKSIDLRDEDKQMSLITNGVLGADTLSLFGLYEVTAYVEDYSFTLDLFIKNIYYSKEPEITVSQETYKWNVIPNNDNTYNVELTSPDLLNKILIKDYDTNYSFQESFMKLLYFETYGSQYTDNIEIFVEIDNKIYELSLKSEDKKGNKLIYTWRFEHIDISQNKVINITYRYQANNGAYYYCNESLQ